MNLNEFVPTHLEDASGVKQHQTIYQLSGKFDKSNPDEYTWRPDIRYGVTEKFQIEVMGDMISGGSEVRGGEARASALYQAFESEYATFAINPFASFPKGKSSDGIDPAIKIILSSNNPDTQIHLNYQIRHNAGRQSGERADEIVYAAGFSRRFHDKLSWIADIIFQDDEEKDSRNDYVETGLHQEFSQGMYLGYGFGKGINSSSPDWSGILSLEVEI